MSITINGSGTIGGVSVGGLPDGIVDTDMLASNAVTSALLPAGSVLQVVAGSTTTEATGSGGAWFDIGLSASITPSNTANKIYISVNIAGTGISSANAGDDRCHYRILRDSTEISYWEKLYGYTNSTQVLSGHVATTFLDNPSSVSSITYKVQMHGDSSETVIAQWNSGSSTITLMEIAG